MASSTPSADSVEGIFDNLGPPGTPFTTPEIAAEFDCSDRTIYNRLDSLVEAGVIETKKVGAKGRVWWKPADSNPRVNGGAVSDRFPVSLRDEGDISDSPNSEMADRIGEFEWAETPLGPIADWPSQLRVAVDIMLGTSEAIGIYWGAELRLLYNDAAAEQIGEKHPDALGQPAAEVFPEAWDELGPIHNQVLAGEGPVRNEEHYRPLERSGELEDIWWDTSFNPIPDEDGSVGGVMNISFDVTDRVRTERRLRELKQKSEAKYRTLFESIDEGFCIIEMLFDEDDQPVDYRFLETNPAFAEITDLPDAEGKRMRDLEPDHEDHWFEIYGDVVKTGESVRFTEQARHLGDRWYDVYAFRIGGPGERTVAILFDDVTERNRTQRRLKEERDMFADGPTVVFRWEPDAEAGWPVEYVSENVEDVLGYTPEELESGAVAYSDLLLEEELNRIASEAAEHSEDSSDRFIHEPYRVRTKTGDLRWVEDFTKIVRDDGGNIENYLGYLVDVTERKRQEERQRFQIELRDTIRPLTDPVEIQHEAARVLGEHLDVDRAHYTEVNDHNDTFWIRADYYRGDVASVVGEHQLSAYGEYIVETLRAGENLVIDDSQSASELSEEDRATYASVDNYANVAVPLVKDGTLVAFFSVDNTEPREWTDTDIEMIEETAERTWAAVQRAQAEQAQKASNESLERLNHAGRMLIDADPETITDRVAELAVDVLDVQYAVLWQYDEQTGTIEVASEHAESETELDAERSRTVSQDRVWETFIGDEIDVDDALDVASDESWPSRLGSRAFVPLGRHGVIVVDSDTKAGIEGWRLGLVEMVASTVESAWDRAESERALEQRNEELTRLDRLNKLIRQIDQGLVDAETVEEITEMVCEHLAGSALYEFAWLGEYDVSVDDVLPQAWAGVDSGLVENLSTPPEESTRQASPFATAVRTGEMQVVADIATDVRAAPWRETTLGRGARSCLVIPLTYDESVYGVLVVYGGQPHPDERDLDVLSELGRTIGHAIHAVETRQTSRTDSVVELTLQTTTADTPLVRLARELNCEIEFEGMVPGADGETTVFFTPRNVSDDDVAAAAEQSLAFEELTHLGEPSGGHQFKAQITDDQLAARFLEAGASIRSLTIDVGMVTAVVAVPESADVREFIEGIERDGPDLELLARRPQQRSLDGTEQLQTVIDEQLTPRQREIIQLAYRSGYFESPRVQTGQELSEALDLSQSTFNHHLRGAERRILEVVFDTA